jgi:hypothetical protein
LYLPKGKLAVRQQNHQATEAQNDPGPIGDLAFETLVGPEEKTLASKGIERSGKATLEQYLALVDSGLDGDVVRRWTENHAAQEIAKRGLQVEAARQQLGESKAHKRRPARIRPKELRQAAADSECRPRQGLEAQQTLFNCPVCRAELGTKPRLAKHLTMIHSRVSS